jgi:TRAP-type C4-dicarboxylate transport system permease small subunit
MEPIFKMDSMAPFKKTMMLEKLSFAIEQVINIMAIIFFSLIFSIMLLQIFFRYVLDSPLVWTEELCRYLFIWICFLGWTIALKRGSHIRISFVIERMPWRLRKIILILLQFLILFFLLQLIRLGIAMVQRSFSVPTITLFFSWAYVYLAAPISAIIMFLYSLLHLCALFRGTQESKSKT